MQAIEAAEIQQAVLLTGTGRHDLSPQSSQRRVAVRHHRCHPIQGAAQDHHDEAFLGRSASNR